MKIFLLFLCLVLNSCSYFYYKNQMEIEHTGLKVYKLNRPLFKFSSQFKYIENSKVRNLESLIGKDKEILQTLFPSAYLLHNDKALYTLLSLEVFEEDISQKLKPSFLNVFSVLTLGIFPTYVTASFKGRLILRDNRSNEIKEFEISPEFMEGTGMFFALLQWRDDWYDSSKNPYETNLSEYFQNYSWMKLNLK